MKSTLLPINQNVIFQVLGQAKVVLSKTFSKMDQCPAPVIILATLLSKWYIASYSLCHDPLVIIVQCMHAWFT